MENRSAETLVPIIQESILPGTTVFSDEWAAYRTLGALGFEHLTVNHSLNFVDPESGANTQRIESMGVAAKAKLKRMNGTYRDVLPTYLAEFLWRRKFGQNPQRAFANFLEQLCF